MRQKVRSTMLNGGLFLWLVIFLFMPAVNLARAATTDAATFYVAVTGSDTNPGTKQKPFATISRARNAVRRAKQRAKGPVTVFIREGTYYHSKSITFGPEDSGSADGPITYAAYEDEMVTLSGGRKLNCKWQPYRDGIFKCQLPVSDIARFTQLYVNGRRQIRARFPNYDNSRPGHSGYILAAGGIENSSKDPRDPRPTANGDMIFSSGARPGIFFNPETFTKKKWANPDQAVIHIYQAMYWGNLQWRVKAIDYDSKAIWFGKGGQQMGAKWCENPCEVNGRSRFFIENVFEELDSPGEWYLDAKKQVLYYKPAEGVDLRTALVEIAVARQLVRFVGTQDKPVRYISLDGFRITHTASTFLDAYSIPSLSDWSIHRGGTVFFEGARNCTVKNCWFDAVGGNGVFMNDHNRSNVVTGCKFTQTGDSAICFVGTLETTVGTQRNFPYECRAVNNLIHDCGIFGKQIAGVYISRAKRITAGHNHIYNMPRAGICIGDGTWGGHIIEYNRIHDTCRETGDHGPFNSWGRDKLWCMNQSHGGVSHRIGDVKIDAMETVKLRYNFFKEDSGWGLDLDDGSSNYEVYKNVGIGVSVKLREGDWRKVYNNVWVNCNVPPGIHVGYEFNHDKYLRNITVMRHDTFIKFIQPPAQGKWMEEIDYNCYYRKGGKFSVRAQGVRDGTNRTFTLDEWQDFGFDKHSVFADPMFVDPENNDYRVKPGSPALKLGFENFAMDKFGLLPSFPKKWR